jgi:uncharacterized protein
MGLIYFHTGFECNLRCRYCFQGSNYGARSRRRKQLDLKTMDRFIGFCAENGFDNVQIYGGEPFMHKELILHALRRFGEQKPRPVVGIVTNGTLLDEEIMSHLEQYRTPILLSLDGNKDRHNKMRGGFDRISPWFPRLAARKPTVALQAGIIAGLADQVRWVWAQGFNRVFINVIQTYDWYKPADVKRFEKEYEKCIQAMLEGEGTLNCAAQLTQLLEKEKFAQTCGIIRKGYACDGEGNVYPCHRAVELGKRFALGTVFQGIDTRKDARLRKRIEAQAFADKEKDRWPHTSFCPVEVYLKHGTFAGPWSRGFSAMIELKVKLVAKYFHELRKLKPPSPGRLEMKRGDEP